MCVYICLYKCVGVEVYVYDFVCYVCMYMCVVVYVYVFMWVCRCGCMDVCMCVCVLDTCLNVDRIDLLYRIL